MEHNDFGRTCIEYYNKKAEETINKINQEYGDQVKIIYRDFPVHGEEAENLAIAAECAKDQGKFWEVHNKIFELQDINLVREYILTLNIDMALYDICVDQRQKLEEINKDRQDGEYYGVEGTPTFFVNGYKLVGDHPFNNFKDLIDYELLNS